MIAKILKATKGFSGVIYSELKVDKGGATFCGAYNFPFQSQDADTDKYIAYMEQLASCANKPVKNRQFHAIISTKGKEHDIDFLIEISQQWMQRMGYGNQPYLIYFHGDTDNNHVHIVSCRVDINGNSIPAYMEGRRAGIAIRELMNEDLKNKATADINDVLHHYSFSTEAQFKLVLEQRGWTIRTSNDRINLIKYFKQGEIELSEVKEKATNYKQNMPRIKQLRAIFNKYGSLPIEELQKMMRDKLGVDTVFHKSHGHTKPYGYTVIDHNSKTVFKGSEILPLEKLINPVSREKQIEIATQILTDYVNSNQKPNYSDIKQILYRSGFSLRKNEVYVVGSKEKLISLDDTFYRNIQYFERLKEANRFIVHSMEEAKVLSILFKVRVHNIIIYTDVERDDLKYRDMVGSFNGKIDALRDYLTNNQMLLVTHNNHSFIIDSQNHTVADVSGMGLENSRYDLERFIQSNSAEIENLIEYAEGGLFAMLVSLLSSFAHGMGKESEQRNRDEARRKRRNRMR
jgi:virulence-associated protein VapD